MATEQKNSAYNFMAVNLTLFFCAENARRYVVYSYGFRDYYATIGRFTSIDPMAEGTYYSSPYAYANNNPVANIDFMGLSAHTTSDPNEIASILGHLGSGGTVGDYDVSDWDDTSDFWDLVGENAYWYNWRGGSELIARLGGRGFCGGGGGGGGYSGSAGYTMLSPVVAVGNFKDGYNFTLESKVQLLIELGGITNADDLTKEMLSWLGVGNGSRDVINNILKNIQLANGAGSLGANLTMAIRYELFKTARWQYNTYANIARPTVNGLRTTRNVIRGLGWVGVGLTAIDMQQNGINVSNSLDAVMTGIAFTGWGAPVSGVYFVANLFSMAFTGSSIGEHIQGTFTDKKGWKPW